MIVDLVMHAWSMVIQYVKRTKAPAYPCVLIERVDLNAGMEKREALMASVNRRLASIVGITSYAARVTINSRPNGKCYYIRDHLRFGHVTFARRRFCD